MEELYGMMWSNSAYETIKPTKYFNKITFTLYPEKEKFKSCLQSKGCIGKAVTWNESRVKMDKQMINRIILSLVSMLERHKEGFSTPGITSVHFW